MMRIESERKKMVMLTEETHRRLTSITRKDETYDEAVARLLDSLEKEENTNR